MATKRARKPKVVVAPVQTAGEASGRVLALQQLIGSQGWKIVLEQIEGNISVLEESILTKTDPAGKRLSDDEVDQLRDKRGYLVELRRMPEKLLSIFQADSGTEKDFDPYAR